MNEAVADAKREQDVDLLANVIARGLSGALKMSFSEVGSIFSAAKNVGTDQEVAVRALRKFIDEHEHAIPILAAALGAQGVERLKQALAT